MASSSVELTEASRRAGFEWGLALGALASGRATDTVRLFGAAEAVRGSCHAMSTPPEKLLADRALTTLRRSLGEREFKSAFQQGRDMSTDEAVLLASELARSLSATKCTA